MNNAAVIVVKWGQTFAVDLSNGSVLVYDGSAHYVTTSLSETKIRGLIHLARNR
jgi:hypothetical protein